MLIKSTIEMFSILLLTNVYVQTTVQYNKYKLIKCRKYNIDFGTIKQITPI